MSGKDMTKALSRKVKEEVAPNEEFSQKFDPYWELFESATENMAVRTFYMRTEVGTYYNRNLLASCDIVAICDGLLIDLQAESNYSVRFDLSVLPLSAVGEVKLHPGGVQNLSDTQGALLTVTTDAGRYWFAKTDEERGYLLDFAQALLETIGGG